MRLHAAHQLREVSLSFSTLEAFDGAVAKACAAYRKRGGSKMQVLPDFFAGAHSALEGWPLLTRNAGRFRSCFPPPEVLAP